MRGLWVMTFFILLACVSFGYDWSTNPGDGSPERPYQIATKADLLGLAADTENYDKCFILTADIDLEGQFFSTAIIAADTDDSTNGFQGTAFTGTLDGNGHKITHFRASSSMETDYRGLFGWIGVNGTIKKLGLENFEMLGDTYNSRYVGSLAGYNEGSISNCYSANADQGYSTVMGGHRVGGLAGYNSGIITNSYSVNTVEGYYDVGGLVGYNDGGILIDCHSTGFIFGYIGVGGLVSYSQAGSNIIQCYATGSIYGASSIGGLAGRNEGNINKCYSNAIVGRSDSVYAGGLVGYQEAGNIDNCFSWGNVKGNFCIGGLVGHNVDGSIDCCFSLSPVSGSSDSWHIGGLAGENGGTIRRSYARGTVTCDSTAHNLGGLVGINKGWNFIGIIENCYAAGSATSGLGSQGTGGLVGSNDWGSITYCYSTGFVNGDSLEGGLIGYNNGGITTNCFWNIATSGQTTSAGGTGKTTTEMKTLATFTDWDFTNEITNGVNNFWRMCAVGADYPRLSWEFAQNGDFTCPNGVGMEDLIALSEKWMMSAVVDPATFNYACDADGSETIDLGDFAILSQHWLSD